MTSEAPIRYEKSDMWASWAGPLETVGFVAETALADIRTWFPDSEVELGVSAQVGHLTASGDSLQVLDELQTSTARAKDREILITVSVRWQSHVQLRFRDSAPALWIRVVGPDRTRVEGLYHRLVEQLKPGRRWPHWYFNGLWPVAMLTLASVLAMVAQLSLRVTGVTTHKWSRADTLSVVGSIAAAYVILAARTLLVPNLELLETGQRTRMVRWRIWVVGLIVALVVGIVASIIAARF